MDLNTLWFILIAVLYTVFFVLEGFDFGVGILLPFLGKNDTQRRVIINTIGPHWDGNEVWLITAGGATFAAFPQWYATMFSGFYLPLFLLLLGLIVRGVAFEFRGKDDNPRWRSLWDGCLFAGSLVAALLLGIAFTNLVRGVPIDANMQYTGGFFNLLNPTALLGGITAVLLFTLHGAIFLSLKTSDELQTRASDAARRVWVSVLVALVLLLVEPYLKAGFFAERGFIVALAPLLAVAATILAGYFIHQNKPGRAFVMTCLAIVFTVANTFIILFPQVMISSLNPAWSLTIYNASSSAYTLRIMTIVAAIFVPLVLAYQGWSYWIFRRRVTEKPKSLVY